MPLYSTNFIVCYLKVLNILYRAAPRFVMCIPRFDATTISHLYVCMLIYPQQWSTRRAIIWQEILRFVSSSVRERRKVSLSISKYRYYTALLAFCYAYKSRSLFAYFPRIVTNSNLALSSTLAPPEHIAHLENSLRQYPSWNSANQRSA